MKLKAEYGIAILLIPPVSMLNHNSWGLDQQVCQNITHE